jgi:hypothetical protein
MDGDQGPERSTADGDRRTEPPGTGGGPARVLTARVPLWALLLVVVVAVAVLAVVVATRSSVDLGAAVDGARNVQVSMTICNEIVDAREVNPREAELDFEAGLKSRGAREANVTVDRIDCGPETTVGGPAGN